MAHGWSSTELTLNEEPVDSPAPDENLTCHTERPPEEKGLCDSFANEEVIVSHSDSFTTTNQHQNCHEQEGNKSISLCLSQQLDTHRGHLEGEICTDSDSRAGEFGCLTPHNQGFGTFVNTQDKTDALDQYSDVSSCSEPDIGALSELNAEMNCCEPGRTQIKWNFNHLEMSYASNVAESLEWTPLRENACSGSDLNDASIVTAPDCSSCNHKDYMNKEQKNNTILNQDGNISSMSRPLETICDKSPLKETKESQNIECTIQCSPVCHVNKFQSLSVSVKDSGSVDDSHIRNMIPKEDGTPDHETVASCQVLEPCLDFSDALGSKRDLQDQFEIDSVNNGGKLKEDDLGAIKSGEEHQNSFEFLEHCLGLSGLSADASQKNSPAKDNQNAIASNISEIPVGEKSVHVTQDLPDGAPVSLVQMDLAQVTMDQKGDKMSPTDISTQEPLLSTDCHRKSPVLVKSFSIMDCSSHDQVDCVHTPPPDDPSDSVLEKMKFTATLDFSADGFCEKLTAQEAGQIGDQPLAHLVSSHDLKQLLHPVVLLKCSSQNVNGRDGYHCAKCMETAPNLSQLIEHHRGTHSPCNFNFCKTCGCYFIDDTLAKQHLCSQQNFGLTKEQKKTFRKVYKCQYCSLTLNRLYEFHKHERIHTGITPFKCDKCGLYFAQSASLNRHKRLGRCRASLSKGCPEKLKGQASNPTLKSQELSSRSLLAQLPSCFVKLVDFRKEKLKSVQSEKNSTHAKSFQLDTLARPCRSDFDRRYKCHNCQKAFRYSSNLCRHKKRCNIGSGKNKTALVKHLKNLVGQYKCPLCPRIFKYSYNRLRHMRVQCLKDFSQQSKSKKSSVYKCVLCTRTFSNSSNRNRHIKMVCMKQYIHRESFKVKMDFQQQRKSMQHQLPAQPQQTGALHHKCSLCPAVFAHSSGKYKHMVKHRLFEKTGKPFKYRNSIDVSLKPKVENSSPKLAEKGYDAGKRHYCCHYCGKNFSTFSALKKHTRLHKRERPYCCSECGKRFLRRSHLDAHKKVHQRRIQCTVCKKIVPTIGELINHRQSHINKGMLQCPDCPLQFKYPTFLLRHLSKHNNVQQNPPEEQECSPQENEQQQEDKLLRVKCSLCQEFFDSATELNKHCLSHMPTRSTKQCPFCKRHFSNRPGLIRHIRLHTGEKPYCCNGCGMCFSRSEPLKVHHEKCKGENKEHITKTPETGKKYSCKYCPQTFFWPCSLSKHQKNHILKVLFPCSKCGKCYKKLRLISHERICDPSATRPANTTATTLLTCLKCGQTFYRKSNQIVHERKCLGAKPLLVGNLGLKDSKCIGGKNKDRLKHRCVHCPKAFRYRCYLLRHLVVHAKDKQYSCMHCGHRYASYSRYLHHEAFCDGVYRYKQLVNMTNTVKEQPSFETTPKEKSMPVNKVGGEEQYKCRFCNKTFMRARYLRRHILTHTGVKPYRCKTCKNRFSRHDHLKVHQNHCKGKKRKLEVRIVKISLEDLVGGWKKQVEEPKEMQMFDCSTCNKSFTTRTNLARHVTMLHTTVKPFSCSRCSTSFSHLSSMKKHDLKCRERMFFPTITSQENNSNSVKDSNITPQRSSREASEILMKVQKPYPDNHKFFCTYCPRRFKNQDQLRIHTRLHTGEKPFGCASCGERFIRRDYLQRHLIKCSFGTEGRESLLCETCGELFFCQDQLRIHHNSCVVSPKSPDSRTEGPECSSKSPKIKGFSCANCSQRFLLFSQLQQHFLTMHRDDASQELPNSSPLKQQMSSIVTVKEEPGDEGYREDLFSKCELLTNKLLPHAPGDINKPYVCPHCNVQFHNASGLGMHLRIHSGQYTFSCLKCKTGFWSKNSLRKHQRTCQKFQIVAKEEPQTETIVPFHLNSKATNTVLVFNSGSKATGTGVLQTEFSCKEGIKDGQPDAADVQEKQKTFAEKNSTVLKYQCSECCQSFTDGLLLISHLEEHNRQKQGHCCRVCGKVFSQPGVLQRHLKMHDKKKPYACSECPKSFRYPSDLVMHKYCHDPNRPFVCNVCGLRFWTNKSLKAHTSAVHFRPFKPPGVHTCRKCDTFFPDKRSYQKHWKRKHCKARMHFENRSDQQFFSDEVFSSEMKESHMHSNNGDDSDNSDSAPYFPCHVCGKTFTTSESLEDHQRCHLGEKPHECGECGKCFFQLAHLQHHQRSHKSEFQCQTCGRGFVSVFALRKHKHSHGKSRPYRCPRCQLSFTGPTQLAEHMATHNDDNFPCDLCDRTFSCRLSRAQHRMSHTEPEENLPPLLPPVDIASSLSSMSVPSDTDELKYRCGICSRQFRDAEQLSEHGCYAGRERPYSCTECNQHFVQGSHLKKHQLSHQLSKPYSYQCHLCHMFFNYHHQFLNHLKGHGMKGSEDSPNRKSVMGCSETNSKKMYKCPICLHSFPHPMELANHLFIHAENILACETCGETFASESNLREHEQCHLTASVQYECIECGNSFLGSNAFQQHLCARQKHTIVKTDHLEPSPELSIARGLKAPAVALSQQTEDEEVEIDVGEDFYNCSLCSKRFPSKLSLEEHQHQQHAVNSHFKCLVCSKSFAKKRYLKKHEVIHQRTYQCSVCLQKFSSERDHLVHQNEHNESERLQSSVCPKNVVTPPDLLHHKKPHTERTAETGDDFHCDMCYRSFNQLSLLRQHQESHVGQVVYECTECDKAFAFFHLLEQHQSTHSAVAPSSLSGPH